MLLKIFLKEKHNPNNIFLKKQWKYFPCSSVMKKCYTTNLKMQRKIKMSLNLYRVSLECLPCAVKVFRNPIQHSPGYCLWVVNGFMETTFCFCFSVLKVLSLSQDNLVASPRAELFIAPSTYPPVTGWPCSLSSHTWVGTD